MIPTDFSAKAGHYGEHGLSGVGFAVAALAAAACPAVAVVAKGEAKAAALRTREKACLRRFDILGFIRAKLFSTKEKV